ncbi:MAG: flippase [Thermodesulfobacteriota bacterium]
MVKNKIARNIVALSLGTAVENLFSYFLIIAIARHLGDVGLGQYSFVIALGYLVVLIANPGLDYLLLKEISRSKDLTSRYTSNILSLKITLTFLALFVTFTVSLLLDKNPIVIRSLWIVAIVFSFGNVGSIFSSVLQANEMMEFISLTKCLERLIAFCLGLYFLSTKHSLLYLFLALLLSGTLRETLHIFLARAYVSPRLGFDISLLRSVLIQSLPYAFTSIFLYIYFRIDTVMLSLMINDQVTGWYSAAYKLMDVLTYIPSLVIIAILPVFSKAFTEDEQVLKNLFVRTFRYLVILAVPLVMGVFLLAPRIILFVYKDGFEEAALALQVLIWAEGFVFVNYLCGHLLNMIDKQKIFTKVVVVTTIFNVMLNLILIPKYSYMGAGVATLLSEALIFILMYHFVKKHFIRIPLWEMVWRPAISSLLMAVIILNLDSLPLWYLLPISTVSYFLCFALLGGVNKQDRDVVSAIFSMMGPKKG